MSLFTSALPVLGLATRTTSGQSNGFNLGKYQAGKLYIYIQSLSGTVPRVTPSWQFSPNGNYATGGNYLTWKSFANPLQATGLAVLTLPEFPDLWGRVSYVIAGTTAALKFRAWFVAKGDQ